MATRTTLSPPLTTSPYRPTSPTYSSEIQTPTSHSPVATPASSRPDSVYSKRGGRTAPPNSVAGCAPYGAFSKGLDRAELRHIASDYEHIWQDPTPTPKTRSPQATPPQSPRSLPADKLDKALATIPESLESLPTPRYYSSSRYSLAATARSEDTSVSEPGDALYISFSREFPARNTAQPPSFGPELVNPDAASEPVPLAPRDVEFLTASGVLEYNTWDMEAHDGLENALRRVKQLAIDKNKKDPSKSVEQYYNEFVARHLSDPSLGIRYTPHEDRKPDVSTTESKSVDARIEELVAAMSKIKSDNDAMKLKMTEIEQRGDKVEELFKAEMAKGGQGI